MKHYGYGIGSCFFCLVMISALSLTYGFAAEPKEKAGSSKAATSPAEKSKAKAGGEATKYAVCSPKFSGQQIDTLLQFLKGLAPEKFPQLEEILLKCDFAANETLLQFITDLKAEIEQAKFINPEFKKLFEREKIKELEVQLALAEPTINDSQLRSLVSEIFDLRQQTLERAEADLKNRIEERKKLKDQIIEEKAKELKGESKPPASDELKWD
jgi:hypothetical protein